MDSLVKFHPLTALNYFVDGRLAVGNRLLTLETARGSRKENKKNKITITVKLCLLIKNKGLRTGMSNIWPLEVLY